MRSSRATFPSTPNRQPARGSGSDVLEAKPAWHEGRDYGTAQRLMVSSSNPVTHSPASTIGKNFDGDFWPERAARELGGETTYRSGRGRWMTLCPAHPDSAPSLQLSWGRDRKRLFHCFAGCEWRAVRDALIERGILPDLRRRVSVPHRLAAWRVANAAHRGLRDGALDASQFIVLMIHIRFAMRARGGKYFLAVRTVSECAPLSRSAVQRAQRKLKAKGWLRRRGRKSGGAH